MKSKLSYRAYISTALIIPTFILSIYLFINRIEAFGDNYNFKFLFVGGLMTFTCVWLIIMNLQRFIFLEITDLKIVVKNILQSELDIKYEDLDGFETTIETSRGGSYEVLYLLKDGKSVVHISEFHLANYKEIKNKIMAKVKNNGFVQFSFFSDWKRYI